MHYVEIRNGSIEGLAVGDNPEKMSFYRKTENGWLYAGPRLTYPACRRFMVYAKVVDEGEKTAEQIEKDYGLKL